MSNKQPIKIATAQSLVSGNPRENAHEISRLMRQAKHAGADLIHFSEGALSGYTREQLGSWEIIQFERVQEELKQIINLAGELELWVVLGSAHQLSSPNRPHNSLYIISSEGKLHTRYDKQWLSSNEVNNWYTPGQGLCIFEFKGWRFGCALCIEIQFPELFIAYLKEEINCLLFSSYSDSAMFGIQAQGYAASHNYWFSFSVPRNTSVARTSHCIGPDGSVQSACEAKTSSFCLSTLDWQDERWNIALNYAQPWRKKARAGNIYQERFVDDIRSKDKTII